MVREGARTLLPLKPKPSFRHSGASLHRLASLPDDTVLLPGHDYDASPTATKADLRRGNQYLRVPDLEAWRRMMGHQQG